MAVNAFDLAARQVGLNERDQNAAISDYLATGGANLDPAQTAWCAAFVNSTLSQTGLEGTGSNMARSFLDWGQAVDEPQRGDLAVFSRGDPNGPYGHVGFFDGMNEDGTMRVLGGNQGDAVSIRNYGTDNLLGFRRAGDAGAPAAAPQSPNSLAGLIPPAPGAISGQANALAPPPAAPPPPPRTTLNPMDIAAFMRPVGQRRPLAGFAPGTSPFIGA